MSNIEELAAKVSAAVREHCRAKGYTEGPWLNPLVPVDGVAAWAMARRLVGAGRFDRYVAVAPEGHVYGYFFEKLGARVLSVFVDYPPRRCEGGEELAAIRGGRVLVIEDDVVSGISLQLVVAHLEQYAPRSWSLYLGREMDYQQLDNVPPCFERIYVAEDQLDPASRGADEAEFRRFFAEE